MLFRTLLKTISRIILVYYCKDCNVIGYSTRYLFIISSETIIFLEISFLKIVKKSIFLFNISCLIVDSTKTIRLLALNFYEMIEISSS